MILSDRNIKSARGTGAIGIEPFTLDQLQSSSYDVRLGWKFKLLQPNCGGLIDPKLPTEYKEIDLWRRINSSNPEDRCYLLFPGSCVLGTTIERFRLSASYVGRLEGKSSLGRLGLAVHSTAGFFDAGFEGEATLELINHSGFPMRIYPEMKIGQMSFHVLSSPAERPYGSEGLGSKYLDQEGPTESRMHLNFGNPVIDHERYAAEHD